MRNFDQCKTMTWHESQHEQSAGITASPSGVSPSARQQSAELAQDPKEHTLAIRGRQVLEALEATEVTSRSLGQIGQGTVEAGSHIPPWFMALQERLVSSIKWGPLEEKGHMVLREYAQFIAERDGGKRSAALQVFFKHLGRGRKNADATRAGGYKSSGELGGYSQGTNWCTAASNFAAKQGPDVLIAELKLHGYHLTSGRKKFVAALEAAANKARSGAPTLYATRAYAAALQPGDQASYFFDGCQYGGHRVTIVADYGSSFLHVSGNTTDHSAVGLGEAKRLSKPPPGFSLTKATTVNTKAQQSAASKHIRSFSFGGAKLVYSITRGANLYAPIANIETMSESELSSLNLKRVPAKVDPAQ